MGIPAFYRFLVERYPKSVVNVVEEAPFKDVGAPFNLCRPNPNGFEFDNLYLDMNAIIHPCFHPEGLEPPKTYDQVFKAVFEYVDRIFSIIRPRKLLFMAIDGVAPRAKMNQQRSRRFRAAKDAADQMTKRQRAIFLKGTSRVQTETQDSNVITPGTVFMSLLSSALQYYIHHRMNMDSGWKGIKVILSDASVPGEGEHKIISYVRLQRNLPGFDPNTRHCLYGLDADLIMLALATHELYFSVLREDVRKAQSDDKSDQQNPSFHEEAFDMSVTNFIKRQKFQFLHVWILREYLAHALRIPEVEPDLERSIDDFVFMCMFVGNDFLPHVPSLEISEGAIDLLMTVYKKEFKQMGGYLTNGFEVNLERVQHFIQAVGAHENAILLKRLQVQKKRELQFGHSHTNSYANRRKGSVSNDAISLIDKVRLGEEGFKDRYYAEKFGAGTEEDLERVRKQAVQKYIEGICWVMHYYYQGVCSWQWFYPYHYAPFASDLNDLDQLKIDFTLGKPFKPYNQLMAVLPAASAHALPLFYRELMTNRSSPISDFYPTDFELDMNGKQQSWQAICKLPFIEESRLLLETAKVEHKLNADERKRNRLGMDILFVHELHSLAKKIIPFCERNKGNLKLAYGKVKRKINPKASGGMNGYMYISEKPVCPVEIPSPFTGMELITGNKVISVYYKCPSSHPHILMLPTGIFKTEKTIRNRDIKPPPVLWHEKSSCWMGRVEVERAIPNGVSGPCLAKFAHRLISQKYPPARRVGFRNLVSFLEKQIGSQHDEPNKNSKKRKKRNKATKEKSDDAVVTGKCDDPTKKSLKKVELKCNPDGNMPVYTDLLNLVNGNHHDEPNKNSKKRKIKNQATNEKSDDAVVTGKCDDPTKKSLEKVELKCKPDGNKPVSTDLLNLVNGNHHDELLKMSQRRKINQVSDADAESARKVEPNQVNDADSLRKVELNQVSDAGVDSVRNVEPNQVSESVVSLDDENCKTGVNVPVSTGLLNLVNVSQHDEPNKKSKKRKKRNQATTNENSAAAAVTVKCDDPTKKRQEIVEVNCKPDGNEPVNTGLLNLVNVNHHDEPVKKSLRRKRNQASDADSVRKVELNQVSLDAEKCKTDMNEPVSTGLLNLVNEIHHDEPDNRSPKRMKSNQANGKSDDNADPAENMQEIVEPNQVTGKCDEVGVSLI
ncbi:5'-3' exoribonuclease 4-like [Impatiens glandulifera]|uniref:5'-3' exoribonuclease 4-like n=1 Tax=Impatiens glandulifera TaxID=253017 RepID=UPI001FB0B929|nr:5'-3' exoribonuclease 4-like [Impatiens glandulifera]